MASSTIPVGEHHRNLPGPPQGGDGAGVPGGRRDGGRAGKRSSAALRRRGKPQPRRSRLATPVRPERL